MNDIFIDFCTGKNKHRRIYSGGRRQTIARAVGIKQGQCLPSIVDATAGFGTDAFVLASLGCRVHMLERHPHVFQLLQDGLKRAQKDPTIGSWVSKRLTFQEGDSLDLLDQLPFKPDVISLDPMFPEKKKIAQVKKELQYLQKTVGQDLDADQLLKKSLEIASLRVVVKRPRNALPIANMKPAAQIQTKNQRFDLYFI